MHQGWTRTSLLLDWSSVPTSTTPASSTDPVTESPFTEAKAKAKALNVGKLVAIVVPSAVTVAGITALAVLWFLGYLTKWHQKCIHVEVPGDAESHGH